MKKHIIGITIASTFFATANNYVTIIDKKSSPYQTPADIGNGTCSYDITTEDIYYGKTAIQTGTNCKDLDGNSLPDESNTITGTHLSGSCKEALDFDSALVDGSYTLKLNDDSKQIFYCDMTNGGFTLISHIYDKDDRDDILDNSNGQGWGDSNQTPTSDASFNLAHALTPAYTVSETEWIYTIQNEIFRHQNNDLTFVDNRFAWDGKLYDKTGSFNITSGSPHGASGLKFGVFGPNSPYGTSVKNLTGESFCGGGRQTGSDPSKVLHYLGYGNIISYGPDSVNDLHNLENSDRSTGTATYNGCGTREAILNIWIK